MTESQLINTVWDSAWENILSDADESLRKQYIAAYPDLPSVLDYSGDSMEFPIIVVPLKITRHVSIMHMAAYRTIAQLLQGSSDVTIIWQDIVARHDPQVRMRHKPSVNLRRNKHEDVLRQILNNEGASEERLQLVLESELYLELMNEPEIMDVYRSFPFNNLDNKLDKYKQRMPWISETQDWGESPNDYGTLMQIMHGMLTALLFLGKRNSTREEGRGAVMVGLEQSHIICRVMEGLQQLSESENFLTEIWVPNWAENVVPMPQNTSIKTWNEKDDGWEGRSYYLETILNWKDEDNRENSQLMKRERKDLLYHAKCLGCNMEPMMRQDEDNEYIIDLYGIIERLEIYSRQYSDISVIKRNDRMDFFDMIKPMEKHGLTLLKIILPSFEVRKNYNFQGIMKLVKKNENNIKVGRLIYEKELFAGITNLVECKILEREDTLQSGMNNSWSLSPFHFTVN
jgi:hypothetical protein